MLILKFHEFNSDHLHWRNSVRYAFSAVTPGAAEGLRPLEKLRVGVCFFRKLRNQSEMSARSHNLCYGK